MRALLSLAIARAGCTWCAWGLCTLNTALLSATQPPVLRPRRLPPTAVAHSQRVVVVPNGGTRIGGPVWAVEGRGGAKLQNGRQERWKTKGQSVPGKAWLLPHVSGVASLRQDRLRRAQALARGMAASAGGSTQAAAAAGRGGQQHCALSWAKVTGHGKSPGRVQCSDSLKTGC